MTAHSAQLSKCMCIKNNLLSFTSDCCLHDTFSKSKLFPAQEAGNGRLYVIYVYYFILYTPVHAFLISPSHTSCAITVMLL